MKFALQGLSFAFTHERNMRIHTVIGLGAVGLIAVLRVTRLEIMFVCVALALVLQCELINTAIEKTIDLTKPEQHPLAKAAKDCAAAAVLISTIFAVIIGVIVFGPHVWEGPEWRWEHN